jgi:hypothetical protein
MMRPLRACLVILSLAGGLFTGLTAAQTDSLEAREIAGLLFTSNAVLLGHASTKASTSGVQARVEEGLGRHLSEEEVRRLEEVLLRAASEALPRADLEAYYADLLVQHFSPEELKDLAAFYRTPLGAKVLHFSSVTLVAEGNDRVERILRAHERDFQERFRAEFLREFPAFRQELERPQRHTR